MISLTKRLAAVAYFAEDGTNIADIGTDHGYIPVYLAQKGRAQRIAASDIGDGPLERARISAKMYGVTDQIEFIKADGLCGIDDTFDTVIIAGMGGDTMVSILSAAPWVLKDKHIILQPQTKIPKLVRWLCANGCDIDDARLVKDAGKMYLVLSVYSGRTGGKALSEAQCYAARPLFINRDPLLYEYLEKLRDKLLYSINGIKAGGAIDDGRYYEMCKTYDEICTMLNEVRSW